MAKKVFVLGVGCQKGGTSWLHRQLKNQDAVDMGFTKEYHVFDARHIPSCRTFYERRRKAALKALQKPDSLTNPRRPNLLRLVDFTQHPDHYFDYFSQLWARDDAISLVGDITPSYAGLPVPALRDIRSELESRGFDVRVVFLMRDPIERIWSYARMVVRRSAAKGRPSRLSASELVGEYFATEECRFRTAYEQTIGNLEQAFDEDQLFFGFYETLFQPSTIAGLGTFLELADFDVDFDQQVNVSPKDQEELELDIATNVANLYRPTYEYCAQRFDVEALWPGFSRLTNR